MADFKDFVTGRTAKAPLSGTESVPIIDGGITKKTTAQAIANLAPGAVSSVDGQTGVVVLSGSYAPVVHTHDYAATVHTHSGYEPTQTAASQAEAEAGTENAIRSFSPLRVFQAIAAKVAASIATLTLAYSSTVKSTQTVDSAGSETHVITDGTTTSTLRVAKDGTLTIDQGSRRIALRCDAATDGPVYGPELLTSAGWTVGANWTESPDDTFSHTAGSTEALTHSAAVANNTLYQIAWTITGRTAGGITVSVGGQSTAASTASGTFGPKTTSTAAFTITPTSDFNGTLSLVSLRAITGASVANQVVKNAAGTVIYESRSNNATSVAVGVNAGRSNTTGGSDVIIGNNAGFSNTTGSVNVFVGAQSGYSNTTANFGIFIGGYAGYNNTTGSSDVFIGNNAGYSNTSGGYNAFVGHNAGYSNTTGGYNAFVGHNAGYSNTTGGYNVMSGYSAARFCADGTTALTDPENSVYIGANARGFDNNDTNAIVIGYNAIGTGANTTVIGNSSTTATRLFGSLLAGNAASTASATNGATFGSAASNAIASSFALGGGTAAGVNQTYIVPLGKTTANATPTVLDILDTATNRPVLPAKAAWHFRGMCIAYGPTYKASAWSIEGVIVRDGSNDTRIVGTPTITLIAQDTEMSGCAVTATADNTNEALAITVTGLAATSIRWTCSTFVSQTLQA